MGNNVETGTNEMITYDIAATNLNKLSEQCSKLIEGRGYSGFVSLGELDELATCPQTDRFKTMRIIDLVHTSVNKNDLLGIAVDSIENNINAKFRLSYNHKTQKKREEKMLERAKEIVDNFNKQVNLSGEIAKAIGATFLDGTYVQYLRGDAEGGYFIDNYPLTICDILPYERAGNPVVEMNLVNLRTMLGRGYAKSKQGRAAFLKDFEEELKNCYPDEVYKANEEGKRTVMLDSNRSGVMRVNNQRMVYGLSPLFRALYAVVMLDTFENSDKSTADARSKKILVQYLNKEIMGDNYTKKCLEDQNFAHKTLTSAWQQKVVVLTPPPTVREISYVEPTADLIPIDTVNLYRGKIMTTLGISFLNDTGSKSLTTANISVKQLIKTINKIARQQEPIIEKWYGHILEEAGIPASYAPKVIIADAEEMDFELRKDLATALYTTFNCSLETTLGLIGVDLEDEKRRRMSENEEGLTEIFAPYKSLYTNGDGGDEGGRPESNENEEKQQYDKEKNQEK